jgi:hypothetical protein
MTHRPIPPAWDRLPPLAPRHPRVTIEPTYTVTDFLVGAGAALLVIVVMTGIALWPWR